jgi:hypothetical protein
MSRILFRLVAANPNTLDSMFHRACLLGGSKIPLLELVVVERERGGGEGRGEKAASLQGFSPGAVFKPSLSRWRGRSNWRGWRRHF